MPRRRTNDLDPRAIASQLQRLNELKAMAIASEDFVRAASFKDNEALAPVRADLPLQEEIDQLRFHAAALDDYQSTSPTGDWQGPTVDALERRLIHLQDWKRNAIEAQDYEMAEEYRVREPLSIIDTAQTYLVNHT